MTEEEFLHQIAPVPRFTALHFSPPDWTLGVMASTRAYITFENPEEIFVFRDKYDGYVFVDAKGTEYSAVVEYAPFQGFGKIRSKKRDIKMNTIDADSHYIAFLEALKNAENETKSESKMEFSYQLKEDTEITSTPLLEFLESRRRKKPRRRNAKQMKRKRNGMMKDWHVKNRLPKIYQSLLRRRPKTIKANKRHEVRRKIITRKNLQRKRKSQVRTNQHRPKLSLMMME